MASRFNNNTGFTVIELLVVVSIIGLLSSVVLAALSSARQKSVIASSIQFEDHAYHALGADAAAVWEFNDNSGSSAVDVSGNVNVLALTNVPSGVDWLASASGVNSTPALNFKGTTGYGQTTGLKTFNGAQGSVSFWINEQDGSGTNYEEVLCIPYDAPGGSCATGFNIWSTAGTGDPCGANFICVWPNSSTRVTTNVPISTVVGKWTHVVVSWSGATMKIFINGKLAGQGVSNLNSGLCATCATVSVGYQPSYGRYLKGYIDQFRIYTQPYF